jgi:hypothetical protein
MGPTTECYGLSEAVVVDDCMLRELSSGELLYKSYRLLDVCLAA